MANPVASLGLVIEVLTTLPSTYTRVGRMFGYRRSRARARTAIPLVTGSIQTALGPLDATIDVTGLFTPADAGQAFLVTKFEAGLPVTARVTPVGGVGGSTDDYLVISAPDDGDVSGGAMHQGFTLVKAPAITEQPPGVLNVAHLATMLPLTRAWRIMGNLVTRLREKVRGSIANRYFDMVQGYRGAATAVARGSTAAPWSMVTTQRGQYARADISELVPDNTVWFLVHLPVKLPARPSSGEEWIFGINNAGVGFTYFSTDNISYGLSVRSDGNLGAPGISAGPPGSATTGLPAPGVGVWADLALLIDPWNAPGSFYFYHNGTRQPVLGHGSNTTASAWGTATLTLGSNRTSEVDIGPGAEYGPPVMYSIPGGTSYATIDALVAANRAEFARLGYV